jgi:hypothetical protein
VSTLYALIDKRHRELYDFGASNADDVVKKRKRILDGRKPAIVRSDRLYQLKEAWFKLEDGPARERVASDIRELLAAQWKEQPTMVETSASPQMQSKRVCQKSRFGTSSFSCDDVLWLIEMSVVIISVSCLFVRPRCGSRGGLPARFFCKKSAFFDLLTPSSGRIFGC